MCQYFFIRLLDIIVFRREKKTVSLLTFPQREGKHSLVELNGWGEGWGVGRENLTLFLK